MAERKFTEKEVKTSFEHICGLNTVKILALSPSNEKMKELGFNISEDAEEKNYLGETTDKNTMEVNRWAKIDIVFEYPKKKGQDKGQIGRYGIFLKDVQRAFADGTITKQYVDGFGNVIGVTATNESGEIELNEIKAAFTKYSKIDFNGTLRKIPKAIDLDNIRPYYEGEDLLRSLWGAFFKEYLLQEDIEDLLNGKFSILEHLEGRETEFYIGLNKKNNEFLEVFPVVGKNMIKFALFPTKGKPRKFNAIHPNKLVSITATDLLANYTPDNMEDDDSAV